jgi:hypothetical protein
MAVYFFNHMKSIHTLCGKNCLFFNHMKPILILYGQNAELLNVTAGGTYSYHCTFKGLSHPELSPDFHGEKPASSCLNCGSATYFIITEKKI